MIESVANGVTPPHIGKRISNATARNKSIDHISTVQLDLMPNNLMARKKVPISRVLDLSEQEPQEADNQSEAKFDNQGNSNGLKS